MTGRGIPSPGVGSIDIRAGKVAIPRLQPPHGGDRAGLGGGKGSDGRNRVTHACEPCRQKKTKCSGERPVCQHCQHYQINCFYADGKRDRQKNEMANLQQKIEVYEKLLEKIGNIADGGTRLQINEAVGKQLFTVDSTEVGGEALADGDAGSTGSVDHITEDISTLQSGGMGYVGKPSTKAWIQRAAQHLTNVEELSSSSNLQNRQNPRKSLNSAFSEYSEDPNIPLHDIQVLVDELPSEANANYLINTYFETVNTCYPIIRKAVFMQQYSEVMHPNFGVVDTPTGPAKLPLSQTAPRWLAILNLIFAISAVYSQLVESTNDESKDHLHYFARARILAFDNGMVYEQPDLQQVQIAALSAVYMIATNQLNRAWNVNGLAIRYAQTLALHLHNDSDSSQTEKDAQARVWYSVRSLERLLAVATGRPLGIRDCDCTTALPKPQSEDTQRTTFSRQNLNSSPYDAEDQRNVSGGEQASRASSSQTQSSRPSMPSAQSSSTSLSQSRSPAKSPTLPPNFFKESEELGRIVEDCLQSIYNPLVTKNSRWIEVQAIMGDLTDRLRKWKEQLPPILDFGRNQRDQTHLRMRMTLALQYHHAMMLINRPCVCGMSHVEGESEKSIAFGRESAKACIAAARSLIHLVPSEPNIAGLAHCTPWWALLYYLSSACAILVLEISFGGEHLDEEDDAQKLVDDASTVLSWLKEFSRKDKAAKTTWTILARLLHAAAPKVGQGISTPNSSPSSSQWSGAEAMAGIENANMMGLENLRMPNFQPVFHGGFVGQEFVLYPTQFPDYAAGRSGQPDRSVESEAARLFPPSTRLEQYQELMDMVPPQPGQGAASVERDNLDQERFQQDIYGEMMGQEMNWEAGPSEVEQHHHQQVPMAPSQHNAQQEAPPHGLWMTPGSFTQMMPDPQSSYSATPVSQLSPSDQRVVDDAIRQRDRDRRKRGSKN